MAVFRVDKNRNYTVMSNYHLRDMNLSLKAKGLLSIMLSLPDNWDYSVEGLTKICREGERAITSAVKELEQFGYVERHQLRGANGCFTDMEYIVHENPVLQNPVLQNAVVDNAVVDNPVMENAGQLNTNISNTDKSNTDLSSKDEGEGSTAVAPTPPAHSSRKKYGLYENVLLSDSEMEKLKKEFPEDYEERIDRLSEYMSSTGKTYRNHLATIRSWARRDKEKIKTSQNTMNRSSQEPTNQQTAAPSAKDDVFWLQQFMKEHGKEFIT